MTSPSNPCHPERSEGSAVIASWIKIAFLAFSCAGTIAHAQETGNAKEWQTFSHLCGRLEYMWGVPANRQAKYFLEKRKPLSKVVLELFQWRESASCCSDLTLVESVTTKRDGSFDFTNSSRGRYFVVAHWKGTHSIAIDLGPQNAQQDDCAMQGLQIDEEGTLDKFITIKLD
jgi:hypothetical protein